MLMSECRLKCLGYNSHEKKFAVSGHEVVKHWIVLHDFYDDRLLIYIGRLNILKGSRGPFHQKAYACRNSTTVVNIALSQIEGLMSVSSKGVT